MCIYVTCVSMYVEAKGVLVSTDEVGECKERTKLRVQREEA